MFLIWSTAFLRPGLLASVLNSRPVVLLGTLSYSIYVWHMLFLSQFVPLFSGLWTHDWKWWLPCSLAVSAASYYGVENTVPDAQAALQWGPMIQGARYVHTNLIARDWRVTWCYVTDPERNIIELRPGRNGVVFALDT